MISEKELIPVNMGKNINIREGDYYCNIYGDIFSTKQGKLKKLKSYRKTLKGKYTGYLGIKLYNAQGISKMLLVHRVIAESFIRRFFPYVSDSEISSMDVDHIDFDCSNNNLYNLRFLVKKEHRSRKKTNLEYVNKNRVNSILKLYFIDKIPITKLSEKFNMSEKRLSSWMSSDYAINWCKENKLVYFFRERNKMVVKDDEYTGNITYDSWSDDLKEKIYDLYFRKGLNLLQISKKLHKIYNGVSYIAKTVGAKKFCFHNNLEYFERYGNTEKRFTEEEIKNDIEKSASK